MVDNGVGVSGQKLPSVIRSGSEVQLQDVRRSTLSVDG